MGFAQQQEFLQKANEAYNAKDYKLAADLFLFAIQAGDKSPNTLYDAACSLSLAGREKEAIPILRQAIKVGYRNVEHLKTDSDLDALHGTTEWEKVVAECQKASDRYKKETADPNRAKLITSDIPLFWKAYDLAQKAPSEVRADIYQAEYFDKGTVGLKDFLRVRNISKKRLADYVDKHPEFYTAVRGNTLKVNSKMDEVRAAFRRLKALYPKAQFSPVYCCIGPFAGGGTVSSNGLLLSIEMQAAPKDLPTSELSPWEKSVVTDLSDFPALVAHECIHFQQKYGFETTLLRSCLQEGSADFLGKLIAGRLMVRSEGQHTYGNPRQKELWAEFEKEMAGTNIKNWLYSGSERGERPVDMGYWMGYKICEAYYNKATDKKQSIKDILTIKDTKKFLADSGYVESLV
jgi:tetratricopeptide (TPR) repeat protein